MPASIVEEGPVTEVLERPLHPYTMGLLASNVDTAGGRTDQRDPGAPPDLRALPRGCSFAPRCPYAVVACTESVPGIWRRDEHHMARCIRVEARAGRPHGEGVYDA